MPLEIRELIIKAELGPQEGAGQGTQGGATDSKAKEQLIRACVEQVLEILREQKER